LEKVKRKLIQPSTLFQLKLSENSTRNIDSIREMESFKHEFQIRCSHFELENSIEDKRISCTICGKNWFFSEERGYSIKKKIYSAEKEES
jgi:hypothetical protein